MSALRTAMMMCALIESASQHGLSMLPRMQAGSGLLHCTAVHHTELGMSSEGLAPHIKYSLAKYVDKGEDAWTQQPELKCTLPGSEGGRLVATCHRHMVACRARGLLYLGIIYSAALSTLLSIACVCW
jgi:hypothetical protein